jgi:hypothetical protein
MGTAPYGIRLLIGAAVVALEETKRLPQTILMYPMTVVSQAAHIVMRIQQNIADLVIKGDEALEQLFPPKAEKPEWATFDEDVEDELPPRTDTHDGERLTEGRFALYTTGEPDPTGDSTEVGGDATPQAPAIVSELDYESLTLAQLRARLPSLRVSDLEELLDYEDATKARAPFQTLLANRITRATAK